MPFDSSCFVISPFGSVSLASVAVSGEAAVVLLEPEGRLAAAPSGVPGVVAEEEGGAGDWVGSGADDEPEPAGGEAGAEEAGAAGGASGVSALSQPARSNAASSDAVSRPARNGTPRVAKRVVVIGFMLTSGFGWTGPHGDSAMVMVLDGTRIGFA